VPNLVDMTLEVTSPVLNPENLSRYNRLYEVWRYHAADAPEDNKPRRIAVQYYNILQGFLFLFELHSNYCSFQGKEHQTVSTLEVDDKVYSSNLEFFRFLCYYAM
jgi:hypothetical protein